MNVYVTKYALTAGIEMVDVRRDRTGGPYVYSNERCAAQYVLGLNAFDNLSDAIRAAETMRARKVAALRKQLTKLEEMSFGAPG